MAEPFGKNLARDVIAQDAYGPIYSAQYSDAVKSSRINELGHRMGMPPALIDARYPDMMAQDRVNRAVAQAKRNPAYAHMMSNPRLAASGIDDHHLPAVAEAADHHQTMIDFANTWQKRGILGVITDAAKATAGRFSSEMAGVLGGFGDTAHAIMGDHPDVAAQGANVGHMFGPIGAAIPLMGHLLSTAAPIVHSLQGRTDYTTSSGHFNEWLGAVGSLPGMATAIGTEAVGGPLAAAATFGIPAYGRAHEEARRAGRGEFASTMYGAGDAAITAGTAFLPQKYLGEAFRGGGGIVKSTAAGAGMMEVQTLAQGLNHWLFIDHPKGVTFEQFADSLPGQMGSTLVSTLLTFGMIHGAHHAVNSYVGRRVDTQSAKTLDAVMEAAGKSTTRKNNPTDFEQGIRQVAGEKDIHIPAAKILELFQPQEGKPQRELSKDPFWAQHEAQIREADQLGGDVTVPLSQFATHLADHGDFTALRDNIRTRPGGSTMAEIKKQPPAQEMADLASAITNHVDVTMPNLKATELTRSFADAMGLKSHQSDALAQIMGAGLGQAYRLESAKREARGEAAPTMEDFAKDWLPNSTKMTQAEYDAMANRVAPAPEAAPASEAPVEAAPPTEAPAAPPKQLKDWVAKHGDKEGEAQPASEAVAALPADPTQFDPSRLLADAVDHIKNGGSPSTKTLAKRYGLTPEQAGKLGTVLAGVRGLPIRMTKRGLARKGAGADVISFIRAMGGIKDNEGHDLAKGRGYSSRPGLINNRTGHSMDAIREALVEAGYFGPGDTSHITVDHALQLIEQGYRTKTYAPAEALDREAADRAQYDDGRPTVDDVRNDISAAAKTNGFELNDEDHDFAMMMMEHGYDAEAAAKGAHELRAVSDSAALLDEVDANGVEGHDYAEASANLRTDIADRVRRALEGPGEEYFPGFDEQVDRVLAAGRNPPASDHELFQTLSQLFDDPDQPKHSMTPRQRAELDARAKQSMARRGGQESLKDQEGGLFSAARDQDTLFQPAYHGSPHIFDRFSLDHIGSGEGAQAYGHGLYFASRKGVAQHYRDVLATSINIDGKPYVSDNKQHFRLKEHYADDALVSKRGDVDAAISSLEKDAKLWTPSQRQRIRYDEALAELEALRGRVTVDTAGRLYHADIPEDGEYLLWDKPLSEQPPKVKEALKAFGIGSDKAPDAMSDDELFGALGGYEQTLGDKEKTGQGFYKEMVADVAKRRGKLEADFGDKAWGRADALASEVLHKAGIAGIKYLDGGSRSDGEGSHNYVVFDDNAVSISQYEQTLRDSQARGNISISRDENGMMVGSIIRAFEHADFSTGVHEIGHFFLEDLKRRAFRVDATDQEKADWQTVKGWAGELGHAVGDDHMVPTEAHESFARGFERYIMEGQAPSAGLKPLFVKMRDFMVSLYRSVRSLNSPITPEIRSVMDRLLASDDEIKARKDEMRLSNLALDELMTTEEKAQYAALGDQSRGEARDQLYNRVLSTLRTEKSRAVSQRKGEIRQSVTDKVDAQPVFRALKALRSGIPQEDGSTVRATIPKQWLLDNYSEGILDQLPKSVKPIVGDEHGVDPESLAQGAGFESADQMIRELVKHEESRQQLKASKDNRSPRRAAIEDATTEQLRNEMGDPYANLEEEADHAVANDREAERISLELRALSRKSGGKTPVPWKEANVWAKAHVRSSTSKDAISGAALQMYAKATTKAGEAVEEALIKKDYPAAFRAKQQQVLNLALMRQAKEAKDEVMSAVKRMRDIAKKKTIASVDQDYLDQAHQLLESVDMKNRPQTEVDKRMAFEAWHAKQVANEVDVIVPPEFRSSLGQTHWSRLSINKLLDLHDAVKQIVALGRMEQTLVDGKRKADFQEGKAEMMNSGGAVPPRKVRGGTTDPSRSWLGRASSNLRSADAFLLKAERLFTWLDNYDPNGPWTRMVYRPFAVAQGMSSDMMREYTHGFNALVKSLPKETARSWLRMVDTPELVINNKNHVSNGEAWRGTKDQVVMMAMNWGNVGNRQRLVDGFGWGEEDVAGVFDRTLTKADWDFVQGVWDSLEPIGQKLMDLEKEVNGIAPERVEAASFMTRHGEVRGGYFPIVYDPTQSSHAEQLGQDKVAPSGGWWSVSSRASSAKERSAQVEGRPLLLSMDVLTRHVGEVIHDVSHRKALNQAKKILGDRDLAGVINTRFGPEYTRAALAWVEGIAKPNAAYSRAAPWELSVARYLNRAVTAVGLGFRLTVLPIQLAGIPFAAKDLKTPALGESLRIVTAHPVKAYNEMLERSAEMRGRSHAIDATIMDMVAEHGSGKLKTIGLHGWDKYAYQGIAYMDVISRTTVWTAGFNKAVKDGMNEDDAVFYADRAVRQSHGIGFQKDRAALQRSHPLVRALYPFFSYQNALWNEFRDLAHRGKIASNLGDYAEIARRSWWIAIVPPLIHAAIHGTWPKSQDGGPLTTKDLTLWLLNQVTLGAVHSLPALGNIADYIEGSYSYRALNWEELGDDVKKGAGGIKKAASGEDELHGSAIKSAMTALGIITAKPLGQIGATAGGLYDYAKGDVHPHNAADWEKLITTGKVPDQPVH